MSVWATCPPRPTGGPNPDFPPRARNHLFLAVVVAVADVAIVVVVAVVIVDILVFALVHVFVSVVGRRRFR